MFGTSHVPSPLILSPSAGQNESCVRETLTAIIGNITSETGYVQKRAMYWKREGNANSTDLVMIPFVNRTSAVSSMSSLSFLSPSCRPPADFAQPIPILHPWRHGPKLSFQVPLSLRLVYCHTLLSLPLLSIRCQALPSPFLVARALAAFGDYKQVGSPCFCC